MKQSNDLLELVQIAYKWRKFILGITGLAAVAAVIISLTMMPNYYKSSVTFYPSNPTMTDRAMLFSETAGENQIDYFGGNSDIDRILTLSQISGTVDYIINKYKLADHYKMDTNARDGRYKVKQKFLANYNTRKTVLGAVEIAVWDQDKNLAAEIANHIALTVDDKNREMINRDRHSVIAKLAERIDAKEKEVQNISDQLSKLKRQPAANAERLKVLSSELDNAIEDLNSTRRIHEQNSISVNLDVSTINITEQAYPGIRKDKPKRSIVCAGYTLTAFILTLLFALIVEKYRQLKPMLKD